MTKVILAATVLLSTFSVSLAADKDTRVYEMRTLLCGDGKAGRAETPGSAIIRSKLLHEARYDQHRLLDAGSTTGTAS